jgi:hypothetical protein
LALQTGIFSGLANSPDKEASEARGTAATVFSPALQVFVPSARKDAKVAAGAIGATEVLNPGK